MVYDVDYARMWKLIHLFADIRFQEFKKVINLGLITSIQGYDQLFGREGGTNGRVGIYLWKAVVSVITEDIGGGGWIK